MVRLSRTASPFPPRHSPSRSRTDEPALVGVAAVPPVDGGSARRRPSGERQRGGVAAIAGAPGRGDALALRTLAFRETPLVHGRPSRPSPIPGGLTALGHGDIEGHDQCDGHKDDDALAQQFAVAPYRPSGGACAWPQAAGGPRTRT